MHDEHEFLAPSFLIAGIYSTSSARLFVSTTPSQVALSLILSVSQLIFAIHMLVFVAVSTATVTSLFSSDDDRSYAPSKKKVYHKDPYRGERLRARQATNFRQSSSTSPSIEYGYAYTSESPSAAWKPITYTLLPEYRVKDARSTTHGKIVPLSYGKTHIPKEHSIILVQTEHPHSQNVALGNNAPYKNYALLHYYVPFEHVTVAKGKPIEEPFVEVSQKPYRIKATLEPFPIYATSTTTTTPAPKTPAPLIEEDTEVSLHHQV